MSVGADRLQEALQRAAAAIGGVGADVQLERPREAGHGDLATNLALRLAKPLGKKPRDVAQALLDALEAPEGLVAKTEIAGPGFINFWLREAAVADVLREIIAAGSGYGRRTTDTPKSINVEFVSANPTGPLHVGHGRGAALGDAIATLLEAAGHTVIREFYVNDAGVQIQKLAQSLWARVQEAMGREVEIPEGGYHGAYLVDLAKALLEEHGPAFADLPEAEGLDRCREAAVRIQGEEQERDLADFGVRFDVFYSEKALYAGDAIAATLKELRERNLVYEKDGALWIATEQHGDQKDRVLRKRDGSFTYFLPDLAYHLTKRDRGFDTAIDVWGADHHGYVPRMAAALAALGLAKDFFHAEIVQLVRVTRGGEEVRFSKRSGEYVTLRDLYEETGVDAARYFFLMRKGDAQFVFDIDLATKQSEENPVYYVQYAHTRMAGIFRTAEVDPLEITGEGVDLAVLTEDAEQDLIKRLAEYPAAVVQAVDALAPHRIIAYVEEVARLVNAWYHHHRVVGSGDVLERARLVLARASQIVLANALALLGVTAPERM